MKYDEIIKLLDAGYTKEDIMAMSTENASDDKAPDKPEDDGAENDASNYAVDISAITDALGEIKDTFDAFKKEMVAMNIMNSKIEITEQSADDILAEIINPFNNDNK